MDNIIIEVSGGLVQAVYSNRDNIDIRILDWDNIDSQNMTAEEIQLQNEIEKMKEIL